MFYSVAVSSIWFVLTQKACLRAWYGRVKQKNVKGRTLKYGECFVEKNFKHWHPFILLCGLTIYISTTAPSLCLTEGKQTELTYHWSCSLSSRLKNIQGPTYNNLWDFRNTCPNKCAPDLYHFHQHSLATFFVNQCEANTNKWQQQL